MTIELPHIKQLVNKILTHEGAVVQDAVNELKYEFGREGMSLEAAIAFALSRITEWHQPTAAATPAPAPAREAKSGGGLPECVSLTSKGQQSIHVFAKGDKTGEVFALTGVAAGSCDAIADHLKDAMIAAILNASPVKMKLVDVKDSRNEVVETILRAEYDKPGTAPIKIWSGARGDVAMLASIMRKAAAYGLPDLAGK